MKDILQLFVCFLEICIPYWCMEKLVEKEDFQVFIESYGTFVFWHGSDYCIINVHLAGIRVFIY